MGIDLGSEPNTTPDASVLGLGWVWAPGQLMFMTFDVVFMQG